MTVVTRFAPSPTGTLHVGNVRTALHNWLWARKHGGRFLLRIDDTDLERSKEEYVDAIRADLAWLGFDIDGEERQSARFALYEAEFEKLKAAGRVYACYETPEELDIRRKILLSRGLPPVYERKPADAPVPEGIAPHWRFRLDQDAAIEWTDMVRGPQHFEPKTMSDPVVRRADGSWLYLLPSVIDDIAMGITHVVRGEDHVSNTASQVQMFAALGATPPAFAHEALLVGTEGKLSKRLGSLGMESLREAGIEPIALVALLARLGTSDPVEPVTDVAPLVESIDFARFGRAPARFDEAELALLNQKILHHTDHAAVANRLPAAITAARWNAIRPNLTTVAEAAEWVPVFDGPFAPPPVEAADRAVLGAAAQAAPAIDWGADPWHALTAAVKEATGAKGRALFLPLRRALTGRDHGPDMAELLPLIDKDQAVARLSAA
ncbi:glutamine--tRNA ligase [Sphingopyxis sp. H038]|uniref:glutamate--tRNA ligase n=1 Tax=unclassified Sphingopyxis TaxID=2614943 RepID=UPI0007317B8F|nr:MULTISPECIES: glutamate--tRNA ligase [unclassified Sphingopyxis]KTD99845.1 glutamine--tRNA ligase [Sphingopyxis sp. H012]KTE05592.1 glutamine--tRNA ligase [Sphingopyxis sp. H093]KTE06930.1 glutamine--tRNA ligase [Sphingopyxis sp. H053]KTE23089.1 glutamine--tRNA ligase [Sphingopyxis sp. H080]KTE32122.1 glutamine--tRNA ligase [Sphingopyxis sp. H038]